MATKKADKDKEEKAKPEKKEDKKPKAELYIWVRQTPKGKFTKVDRPFLHEEQAKKWMELNYGEIDYTTEEPKEEQ